MHAPKFHQIFKLLTDASDLGVGSVPMQEGSDDTNHPVSYFSKMFSKYQKNYSINEKETCIIVSNTIL